MKDPFKEHPRLYPVKIPYPQFVLDWLEQQEKESKQNEKKIR